MSWMDGEKLIVGYDLGNDFCQISYCLSADGEIETLSQTAGAQNYNIPAVLCKRSGVNQWFFGKEALRFQEQQEGILVDNLLQHALDGEQIVMEGENFDPVALLTLFVKRSLGMLSQVASPDKMYAILFTARNLDYRLLEVLQQVSGGLRLKTDKIYFQGHTESFFEYMVHQPEELWRHQALLLDYEEGCIRSYRMECNRRTTPIVSFIDEQLYPFMAYEPLPSEASAREKKCAELDAALLRIAEEICGNYMIGSVFLIGDGFEQDWMKESLRFLCKGRRVFQGNNLFGKGACLGLQKRLLGDESNATVVFLGNEKLKANIGMKVFRKGEESYLALLDAGKNWYEAENEVEVYVQDANFVELVVTPLIGAKPRLERLLLEDFPGTARVRMHLAMESEKKLSVEIFDLGFGEIRESTGRSWEKKLELY